MFPFWLHLFLRYRHCVVRINITITCLSTLRSVCKRIEGYSVRDIDLFIKYVDCDFPQLKHKLHSSYLVQLFHAR